MARIIFFAVFAACFALGCSNNEGLPGIGGNGGGEPIRCDAFAVPPAGCGESCGRDANCEMGLYCAANNCLAECTASNPCGPAQVCTDRGRCVNTLPDGGGTGGTDCTPEVAVPAREIPNVMFLVDRSGSMLSRINGGGNPPPGQSRWEVAHDAIASVMNDLDSIVRFGLTTYHWNNDEYTGDANDPDCPILNTVGFADNNATNILMNYSSVFPDGNEIKGGSNDTPTGESIDALVAAIVAEPPLADGPTIIALATDGEPDTCAVPDPQRGQDEAVTAATNAYATTGSNGDPIQTFVLSVGSDPSEDHLQDMANVGVGKPKAERGSTKAKFWEGTTPAGLEAAFREIVVGSIVCDITLDRPIANQTKACEEGNIQLNGTRLMCPTDWQITSPTTIELLGTACEQWKSGLPTTLSLVFSCGTLQAK